MERKALEGFGMEEPKTLANSPRIRAARYTSLTSMIRRMAALAVAMVAAHGHIHNNNGKLAFHINAVGLIGQFDGSRGAMKESEPP